MTLRALLLLALTAGSVRAGETVARRPADRLAAAFGLPAPPHATEAGAAAAPSPEFKSRFLAIMSAGSLEVSRTKVHGGRYLTPAETPTESIPALAERNFHEAATLVVERAADLPLSRATAERLNAILTRDLVPAAIAGAPDYRRPAGAFYDWLESDAAAALGRADPVALAERVHYEISALDAFPDGNGRTARLMADLVLLRHGMPPVYYSGIEDYFARGNPRAPAGREARDRYFREMAERGRIAAARGLGAVPPPAPPSPEFLARLEAQSRGLVP